MEPIGEERWRKLCAEAAVEQDHARLLKLIAEITELLGEKERRLQQEHQEKTNPTR
jgi:hypothetical protein